MLDLGAVPELEGSSYQRLMVAQPIKLGGCGLRSLAELRHSAFVRGVEQAGALPRLHCETGRRNHVIYVVISMVSSSPMA